MLLFRWAGCSACPQVPPGRADIGTTSGCLSPDISKPRVPYRYASGVADKDPARKQPATLLQGLMWRRNLTREETVERLEARARAMGETQFSLKLHQLDLLLAGKVKTEPRPANRRVLEAEFGYPTAILLGPPDHVSADAHLAPAGMASRTLSCVDFVSFLAERSGASFEETYAAVAERAEALSARPSSTVAAEERSRSALDRGELAKELRRYYASPGATFYTAKVVGTDTSLALSVLTDEPSTSLSVELGGASEKATVSPEPDAAVVRVTPALYWAAVNRLAAAEVEGPVLAENPLYRLLALDLEAGALTARFGRTTFSAYALGPDLLGRELVDAMVGRRPGSSLQLPLRDAYLPSLAAARDYASRLCVGGTPCLLAIAREDDYALVVQERSARVLNAAGRLAVVPKAFHQPLSEDRPWLSATITRELEEELFGRQELDQLCPDERRLLAPAHHSMMTPPMRWLDDHPGALRLFLTAFGTNMLSGNYEASCLVLIDDATFWEDFGGTLRANWEVGQIRLYSSRDTEGLTRLLSDPRWSDEGLFAFIEGLRLLAKRAPARARPPGIEVSL